MSKKEMITGVKPTSPMSQIEQFKFDIGLIVGKTLILAVLLYLVARKAGGVL